MDKYNCSLCANAGTPICERCVYITKAGGEKTKPTMFLRLGPVDELFSKEELEKSGIAEHEDLAVVIGACILGKVPIPVNYVMRYNRLVESEEEGDEQA